MTVRVAAIVVSWNSAEQLEACLAALDRQDHTPFEVVVVDNASTDASRRILADLAQRPRHHPLHVVHNATNRGFCGGVNDGLAVLDDTVGAVLLVNPDVVAERRLTARCVAALAADPRRGSIQPRLHRVRRASDGAAVIDTTGHVLTRPRIILNRGEEEVNGGAFEEPGEVFGASGACVLHRRRMLDDVAWAGSGHVLTEDLVAYFDDVELDFRARRRGWTAWYEPSAVAIHERGGAGPRRTPWVEALSWSNRLLVTVTCDRVTGSDLAGYALVTTLKTVELALTAPRGLLVGVGRLRHLPAAYRRRRQLDMAACVPIEAVIGEWARPMPWRRWVATWWRRRAGSEAQPSSS